MKVVVLAAGRSSRMKPIEDKNFLEFLGKPLIAHQLDALITAGFKEILVIGGDHNLERIRKAMGNPANGAGRQQATGVRISFKEQENLDLGMAGAILSAEKWIKKEPFFAVSANDVLDGDAYSAMVRQAHHDTGSMLAYKVSKYFPGGYLKVSSKGLIKGIIEKPGEGKEPSKLVNIVVHYHPNPEVLIEELKKVRTDRDDRYECALQSLFDKVVHYKAVPYAGFWQPIKYPWHVVSLMNYFLSGIKSHRAAKVEVAKTAVIKGEVYLEDGVKVLDNAVIQGPAYIGKNSVIGNRSVVTKDIPQNSIAVGNPAKVIRKI